MTFRGDGDDIAALMKHLEIERADVMGYSPAAAVALRIAVRHPDMVRKLVLVSIAFSLMMDPEIVSGMAPCRQEALRR